MKILVKDYLKINVPMPFQINYQKIYYITNNFIVYFFYRINKFYV